MINFTQTSDLKLEGKTTVKGSTVFHINSKGKQIMELKDQKLKPEGKQIWQEISQGRAIVTDKSDKNPSKDRSTKKKKSN